VSCAEQLIPEYHDKAAALDLDNNCQTPTDIAAWRGVDVSYGCSDITEVVSWLLNEDTEAADVLALGREFHSGMVLGEKDLWNSVVLQRGIWSLCCVTFYWYDIKFDRRHRQPPPVR